MPEVVLVSTVENMDKLKSLSGGVVQESPVSEITQAIGMHSLLIDPQHTMKDQAGLYHGMSEHDKRKDQEHAKARAMATGMQASQNSWTS